MKMPRFTFAEIAATLPFIQANGVVMPYNQTKENIHKKFSTNKRSTHSPTTLWPIGWRSTWSFFVLEWLLFFSLITFSRWEFFFKETTSISKMKADYCELCVKIADLCQFLSYEFLFSFVSKFGFFYPMGTLTVTNTVHSLTISHFTLFWLCSESL